MRIPQPSGTKGSLKWMQRAVEFAPHAIRPRALPSITWVSPLAADDYAEYRDSAFLDVIGLARLSRSLADFWPKRGPQWDGLAVFEGGVLLSEAKAHLGEFETPASQAGPKSAAKIARAFADVQTDLGLAACDWSRTYYQYANRLAHLWWLRSQGVDAHLALIAFLNDNDMPGYATAEDWKAAYASADAALGLPRTHALSPFVHYIYCDCRALA